MRCAYAHAAHFAHRCTRRWLWILACLLVLLPAAPAAADDTPPAKQLPIAVSFAVDGVAVAARKVPLLVLFSRANCSWCDRARQEFLLPMMAEPDAGRRVLVRQIDIDSDASLVDFTGNATTHRRFAQSQHARFAPTLMFYGPDGKQVAEPVVGFLLADFYSSYIERGIDAGLARLRDKNNL